MPFTFDHDTHIYRVDGEIWPSASGIVELDLDAESAKRFYNEEARWRGTRVHRHCLLIDLDMFDGTEHDDDALLVQSYITWRNMVRPIWSSMEEARFSRRYRFCGTADRVGQDGQGRAMVLDFKTGNPEKWHGLQLALYDLLHDDLKPKIRRRVALYLQKDGSMARGVEFKAASDYDKALQLLRKAA